MSFSIFDLFVDSDVKNRIDRMEIPFNEYGIDPYGITKQRLSQFLSLLKFFYQNYFSVTTYDIENIPSRGRAMIVSNHSGGVPVDAAMIITSCFLEKEPPRLSQGMVEYFANQLPFISKWFTEFGQVTGLPENCIHLLEDERLLMVFPEGIRGTGKLYKDRYNLVRFGTGFMRLALETNSPIIPTAFVGGEEALPTIFHIKRLAKLIGIPYIPVPPHILPVPLPVSCQVYYGEPMTFEGDGTESDQTIKKYIDQVKEKIGELINRGLERRKKNLFLPSGKAVVEKETERNE